MMNIANASFERITRRAAVKRTLVFAAVGLMAALAPSGKAQAGAGRCGISGCPCPQFQATYGSDLCSNCGHRYSDHW
jgi:hypothetical protein